MIPTYPTFTKLSIDHKNIVNRLIAHTEPYSDFNFVSIFAWNTDNNAELSLLNKNLVVKIPDYISGDPIITLIGENEIDETIRTLLQQPLELKLVPEATADLIKKRAGIDIVHDDENDDYIYELGAIANMSGGKFKKKRNKLSAFTETYGERISFQEFSIGNHEKTLQLKKCFDEWAEKRGEEQYETDNERKAIDRLLENAHHFKLKCYEVWIDNTMAGFSINEILDQEYAICHFQKALLHHINLEVYLNNLVAKHLLADGCRFVNWEQDLGIEGLRQTKASYGPVKVLKKYRVRAA